MTDNLRRRTPGGKAKDLTTPEMSQTEQSELETENENVGTQMPPLQPILESEKPWKSRSQSFRIRVFWSFVLVLSFAGIIALGHFYCSLLVILIAAGIFSEIISLKRNVEKDNKLPLFYALRWYFFFVTVFESYRRFLAGPLDRLADKYELAAYALKYSGLVCYSMICIGLITFVLSLRHFTLRYQFQQLSWTITTLVLIVVQAMAQIANIYSGLIWFLLPTSLVICNDVFAYLFGFFFGKTPLIKLSPKKTWEGFLGGSLATMVWAVLAVNILELHPFLYCPQDCIIFKPAVWHELECSSLAPRSEKAAYQIAGLLNIWISPMQFHALVLGAFASLVAPFGGFFASGFKRAFKIKDFGDSIPGHGGITDRFDCQIIMGMFTYIYFFTYVDPSVNLAHPHSAEVVMSMVEGMPVAEKQRLLQLLSQSIL